jgi:hypothetical protein
MATNEGAQKDTLPVQLYVHNGTSPVKVTADPLAGYILYQYEDNGTYFYVALESSTGAWVLKRLTNSTGQMLYCKGDSDVSTAYTNRASQTYESASIVF